MSDPNILKDAKLAARLTEIMADPTYSDEIRLEAASLALLLGDRYGLEPNPAARETVEDLREARLLQ